MCPEVSRQTAEGLLHRRQYLWTQWLQIDPWQSFGHPAAAPSKQEHLEQLLRLSGRRDWQVSEFEDLQSQRRWTAAVIKGQKRLVRHQESSNPHGA